MREGGFERVSKAAPCKQCGKPDYCYRLLRWDVCMRIPSNRPHEKGGWLHIKDAASQLLPIPPPPRRVPDSELAAKWTPIAEASASEGAAKLSFLAAELGVDTHALELLQIGYAEFYGEWCWTFPERNSNGWIIGIMQRIASPFRLGKLFAKGSRRGLTYCDGWDKYPGVIWIVEGGSDVAAGLSLDLCVVGRPSNTGGVEMLAQLLKPHGGRKIIVLGENDKKTPLQISQMVPQHDPQCRCCLRCFPGRAGARQSALALAKKLGATIRWMMPPAGIKDLRAYVRTIPNEDRERYGKALSSGRFSPPRL